MFEDLCGELSAAELRGEAKGGKEKRMEWSVREAAECGDIQLSSSRSDAAQTHFQEDGTNDECVQGSTL